MQDIFRFVALRAAQESDQPKVIISIIPDTLRKIISDLDDFIEIKEHCRAFFEGDKYINEKGSLQYGNELDLFIQDLSNNAKNHNLTSLGETIEKIFEINAVELVANDGYLSDVKNIHDSVVTSKILPEIGFEYIEFQLICSRVVDLIRRVAVEDEKLNLESAIVNALEARIVLPKEIFPLKRSVDGKGKNVNWRSVERLVKEAKIAQESIDYFCDIKSFQFKQVDYVEEPVVITEEGILVSDDAENEASISSPGNITITTDLLVLNDEALNSIPDEIVEFTDSLDIDLNTTSLGLVLSSISNKLEDLRQEIYTFNVYGGYYPIASLTNSIEFPKDSEVQSLESTDNNHKNKVGKISNIGISDLLVLKEEILRYEEGEVAHIENVLKGEAKTREHVRKKTVEETSITEVETIQIEEKDLQSAEHSELQRESNKVVSEDSKLQSGVNVSASYGPSVTVDAYVGHQQSRSKENSKKIAQSYSKDVVSRSTNRISERVREVNIRRVIQEFEEKNTHTLTNDKSESEHISGIYQWLNKVYRAQVYNYGKRMLFDVAVPEPAAFYHHANSSNPVAVSEPPPFTIRANQITESNFYELGRVYRVQDLESPPEPVKTVSVSLAAPSTPQAGSKGDITLPLGYRAASLRAVGLLQWMSNQRNPSLDLVVGDRWKRFTPNSAYYLTGLNGQVGTISLTYHPFNIINYTISVEITCLRTQKTINEWKIKTHSKIMSAYLAMLADYEERKVAAEIESGVKVEGNNPYTNRELERDEIKKACISIISNQHYDTFNGIELSPNEGFPQINLAVAQHQGKYIRFFEQAFEWEQLTYVLYPYYWGRKEFWPDRLLTKAVDPEHVDFLKAGSARCLIPTRPGFESAVTHFLETGEIWDGGELPDVNSPMFVSILEEIKESRQSPGVEEPYGDSWEVTVPTSLIRLKKDDELPKWD